MTKRRSQRHAHRSTPSPNALHAAHPIAHLSPEGEITKRPTSTNNAIVIDSHGSTLRSISGSLSFPSKFE